MSHECHGDCPEHQHEAQLHAAEQLGSLCCSGHCHHPEHHTIAEMSLAMRLADDEEYDEFGNKRKKKKAKSTSLSNWQIVEISPTHATI